MEGERVWGGERERESEEPREERRLGVESGSLREERGEKVTC